MIAAAAALLLAPAAASMATTLSRADSGPTTWGAIADRPLDSVTDGVLRAGDGAQPGPSAPSLRGPTCAARSR